MSAVDQNPPALVTDVHSALNRASVRLQQPGTTDDVIRLVSSAQLTGSPLALCGGRHAMGGQQFADGQELLDLRNMNRVLEFDMQRGHIRVEAGIQWPDLVKVIQETQQRLEPARPPRWGIAQKKPASTALRSPAHSRPTSTAAAS